MRLLTPSSSKRIRLVYSVFILFFITTISFAQQVSGGGSHSIALCTDGSVKAFGDNYNFQLGDTNNVIYSSDVPIAVNGLNNVIAVSAGGQYNLALKSDGTVWAWGNNDYGQLGKGDTISAFTPTKIDTLTNIVAISAGSYFALALKGDGSVWAWGDNSFGQLGDGTTLNKRRKPARISSLTGLSGAISISAGDYHSLAIKADHTVWAWGDNSFGQLGNGTLNNTPYPIQVQGIANANAIDAGGYHSLALLNNGFVWAWGSNGQGQLGNGSTTNDSLPVMVQLLSNVNAISAGGENSLALKNDSTVWSWGFDFGTNLGRQTDPVTNGLSMPAKVSGLSGITKINCGQYHDLAYKNDGTFWGWGENYSGQLGIGPSSYNIPDPAQVVCPCGSAITPTVSAGAAISICPNTNVLISATGNGIAPLSYHWSEGYHNYFQTTADTISTVINIGDVNVGDTIQFLVTVSDKNRCSSAADTLVTTMKSSPPPPYIFSNPFPTVCNGNAVTLTASGGINYTWLPGGSTTTTIAVAPTVNATYTLASTNTVGCSSYQTTFVNIVEANVDVHNISCSGNGYALANPTGGSYPYSYVWSSGSTTSGAYGLTAGNYTLTVTDGYGCSAQKTFPIINTGTLTLASVEVSNETCFNNCDGRLIFHVSGGTPPYNYYVGAPLGYYTSDTVTYLCQGSYSVQVTDAGGCSAFQNGVGVITGATSYLTSIDSIVTNVSCYGGSNGSTTPSVSGGMPPYTYLWTPGGQTTSSATGLSAGVYSTIIYDYNGCSTGINSVAVTQPTPLTDSVSSVNLFCHGANNGSASVSVSGGTPPYSYLWSNGGTIQSISNLIAGNYSVTVFDNNSCSLTSTVSVTQPAAITTFLLSQTNVSCNGNSDGVINTVTTGGTGPASLYWNTIPVQVTPAATGLSAGTYTLTATDQAGCIASTSFTLIQPAVLISSLSSTATSCFNTCSGTATAIVSGGTSPFTYLWSSNPTQAGPIASGLCAGNYSVGIVDSKGCITSNTVSVSGPLPIPITATATPTSCGSLNGTATATISGAGAVPPFKLLWNTGSTTLAISNLNAGIYRANVIDGNGCFSFADALVSNSNGPVISTNTVTAVSCNGLSTGAININVTGGATPYSFFWSNGATTEDITNVSYGPYEITVTDAGGCRETKSIFVNSPSPLSVTSLVINSSCTVANGKAAVVVSGGNLPYHYAWTSGSTTSAVTPAGAGIYSVTVSDSKGCSTSSLVAVSDSGGPVAFVDSIAAADCGNSGFVLITPLDSGSIASYLWSNGSVTQNLLNAPSGNYGLVITDTSGCKNALVVPVKPVLPPVKPICLVSVDTSNRMNIIVWDKPISTIITGFNIYRESSQNGIYQKVAFVPYNNLSIYYDSISNPANRWAKYRISMKDVCGREGTLSPEHKTIHLSIPAITTQAAHLIWDDYVGYAFSYYHIFRKDSTNGNWNLIDSVPAAIHQYTDYTLLHLGDTVAYDIEISNIGGCVASLQNPQILVTNLNSSRSNIYRILDTTASSSVGDLTMQHVRVTVFPNPSSGIFTIEMQNNSSSIVKVFNMLGEEVKRIGVEANRNKTEVDLSKLGKGIYYLQIISDHNTITKKVVME